MSSLSPKRHKPSPWWHHPSSHHHPSKRRSLHHRSAPPLLRLALRVTAGIALLWTLLEVLFARHALTQPPADPYSLGRESVYIVGIHWNNEPILRSHWNAAVLGTATAIRAGGADVYVSVQESGSWDDTKGALRELDAQLAEHGIPRTVILDETTHEDEIRRSPSSSADEGWIRTARGGADDKKLELRRIPYLARLRNLVMEPMWAMANGSFSSASSAEVQNKKKFDKILFLNDVVFTPADVATLLGTRNGSFAAACSLDFNKPPSFYDTFALRDAEGANKLMKTWPFFRAAASRRALKADQPVPVASCWNGIVAMDARPFYDLAGAAAVAAGAPSSSPSSPLFSSSSSSLSSPRSLPRQPLTFRALPRSLADHHLEASECCLIHADNPLSATHGVWLNPKVRVGYSGEAYAAVNPGSSSISEKKNKQTPWLPTSALVYGAWKNRVLRWTTTAYLKDRVVRGRLVEWREQQRKKGKERIEEPGEFCVVDEMQVVVGNGWAHV